MFQTKNHLNQNKTPFNTNKIILFGFILIILIVSFIFLRSTSSLSTKKNNFQKTEKKINYPTISPQKIFQAIQKENVLKYNLLDIRSSQEYRKEHILDSSNINFQDFNNNPNYNSNEKLNVLITNYANDKEIKLLWENLNPEKKQNTFILEGGLANWIKNAYPVVSLGDIQSFVDQSKVKQINLEELKKIIAKKNKFTTFVDIRNYQEYKKNHLKDAINIPFYKLEKERQKIALDNFIILYSSTGKQAFQYGVMLYDLGFNLVTVIQDGFDAEKWKNEGLEISSN